MDEAKQSEQTPPICPYCNKPFREHMGLAGMCRDLSAARARIAELEATVECEKVLRAQADDEATKHWNGLCLIAQQKKEMAGRIAELEAIVARLPQTADGVPVISGDILWHPRHIGREPVTAISTAEVPESLFTVITTQIGRDGFVCRSEEVGVEECYSTEAAALAAKEAKP